MKYKSASSLPFLCVVDAHTGVSRRGVVDLLDKVLMQMVVGSQFWMESGGELMPLSDSDDVTIYFGQDFDIRRKCAMDVWRTDERHG